MNFMYLQSGTFSHFLTHITIKSLGHLLPCFGQKVQFHIPLHLSSPYSTIYNDDHFAAKETRIKLYIMDQPHGLRHLRLNLVSCPDRRSFPRSDGLGFEVKLFGIIPGMW